MSESHLTDTNHSAPHGNYATPVLNCILLLPWMLSQSQRTFFNRVACCMLEPWLQELQEKLNTCHVSDVPHFRHAFPKMYHATLGW